MIKKIDEIVWIILAMLILIGAFVNLINRTNILGDVINWMILAVLCFIVSLQLRRIRKDEEA